MKQQRKYLRMNLIRLELLKPIEEFSQIRITNMKEKMIKNGLWIRPICIEEKYWLILDGHHRYNVAKQLGYKYIPGRWKPVAETLIENYKLKSGSKVLDIGCGKGYLLHEIKLLIPELEIKGIDISKHGLNNAKEEVKPYLINYRAEEKLPFDDSGFDLVISLGALHNLPIYH